MFFPSASRCVQTAALLLLSGLPVVAQLPTDSIATGRAVYRQIVQFGGARSTTILQTTLLFNNQSSLYQSTATQTKLDTAQSEIRVINLAKDVDVTVYSAPSAGQLLSREYVLNKLVTVLDTLRMLPWQLGKQSRQIGKFSCQNALVNFRGRSYEAWFTPDIPVPHGPWKLQGLPGLIVEASDTEKEVIFSLLSVDYPLAPPMIMHVPPAGQVMTYGAYRKLQEEKLHNLEKLLRGASSSAGSQYEVGVKVRSTLIERSGQ